MKRLISVLLLLTFLLTPVLLSSCVTEKIIYVTEPKEDDDDRDEDDDNSVVIEGEQSATESVPGESRPEDENPGESDSDTEEEEQTKARCGIYCDEGVIYNVNFETGETAFITDDLGAWTTDNFQKVVIVTPDGQYAFFPAALKEGDTSYTLLLQDLTDDSETSIEVADRVTSYYVASDSETVIYLDKSGELCLYHISAGTSETIHKNVDYFESAENGRNLIFSVKSSGKSRYYRILNGKYDQPTQLPEGFSAHFSDVEGSSDYTVLYYEESNTLYMLDELYTGGPGVEIDSQIAKTCEIYDGSIYYTKESGRENISQYLINDIGESGEALLDALAGVSVTVYDLHWYNGEKSLLAENVSSSYNGYVDAAYVEHDILLFTAFSSSTKIKLSSLIEKTGSLEELYYYLEDDYSLSYVIHEVQMKTENMRYLVKGGEVSLLVNNDVDSVMSGYLYGILDRDSTTNCGDLYVVSLNGEIAGEPLLISDRVYGVWSIDDELVYQKNGNLYVYSNGSVKLLQEFMQDVLSVSANYIVYEDEDLTWYCYSDGIVIALNEDNTGSYYIEDEWRELGYDVQWAAMQEIGGLVWDVLTEEEYY